MLWGRAGLDALGLEVSSDLCGNLSKNSSRKRSIRMAEVAESHKLNNVSCSILS
jgi:hypothetical protein